MGTACRISEATAIQPRDIDFALKSVHIRRSWKMGAGKQFYLGSPKSRRGNRTVLLGDSVCEILRPLTAGKGAEDLVFTTKNGYRVNPDELRKAVWTLTLEKAKIDKRLIIAA